MVAQLPAAAARAHGALAGKLRRLLTPYSTSSPGCTRRPPPHHLVATHLLILNALNTGLVTSPRKNMRMQPMAPRPFSKHLPEGGMWVGEGVPWLVRGIDEAAGALPRSLMSST